MKKLIAMIFLFIGISINGQNLVQYIPSNDVISNPERGFYHHTSTGRTGYNSLVQSTLTGYRVNQNITTIYREFDLNEFLKINTDQTSDPNVLIPISSTYLTNMQNDFNAIRAAGLKAIIRFSYSKDEGTRHQQPVKSIILQHIAQLTSVVNNNKDVIVCIQAGFIGTWGEWYYTNSTEFGSANYDLWTTTQWANRNEVLTAMETSFNVTIPLQVRYIYILDKTRPAGTDRIGIYNDAFLNVWGNSGTFFVSGLSGVNTAQESYLQNLTTNLPMTGETDAVNSPKTDCPNTLFETNKYNWSLLNTDYQAVVIAGWQEQNCYTDLQKKLGYRFELINSVINNNIITLRLQNSGYSNVFKSRKASFILKSNSTGTEYNFQTTNDLRTWKKNTITEITQNLNYPGLPNGQYKVYLYLPDPNNNNISYSIRCANTGTWYLPSGYNDLNQTITINNLSVEIFVRDNIIGVNNLLGNYTIKIYDMFGRLVKSNSNDISSLLPGMYIVKIKSDNQIYTQKIIK